MEGAAKTPRGKENVSNHLGLGGGIGRLLSGGKWGKSAVITREESPGIFLSEKKGKSLPSLPLKAGRERGEEGESRKKEKAPFIMLSGRGGRRKGEGQERGRKKTGIKNLRVCAGPGGGEKKEGISRHLVSFTKKRGKKTE